MRILEEAEEQMKDVFWGLQCELKIQKGNRRRAGTLSWHFGKSDNHRQVLKLQLLKTENHGFLKKYGRFVAGSNGCKKWPETSWKWDVDSLGKRVSAYFDKMTFLSPFTQIHFSGKVIWPLSGFCSFYSFFRFLLILQLLLIFVHFTAWNIKSSGRIFHLSISSKTIRFETRLFWDTRGFLHFPKRTDECKRRAMCMRTRKGAFFWIFGEVWEKNAGKRMAVREHFRRHCRHTTA